jgi:hypothetical protein
VSSEARVGSWPYYDYSEYAAPAVEGVLHKHVNLSEVGTDPNRDARSQKCRQATFVMESVWDLFDGRSVKLTAGSVGTRAEAEWFVSKGAK